MLEQRHNTHALSSYNSSSNNHSYDFENKNKIIKPINIKENFTQLSNAQMNKVNDILNKYNLISEKSSNKEEKEEKSISKINKKSFISEAISSPRSKKKKKKLNLNIKKMNLIIKIMNQQYQILK